MRSYRAVIAALLVIASVAWAQFHLAAWLHEIDGNYGWLIDPIWLGFLFALPVIWVRRYGVRLLWSVALPLAIYVFFVIVGNPHPGFPKRVDLALLFMSGGVCAAQVRSGWTAAWTRIHHRSPHEPGDTGRRA